ncbi:hypothetical protein E3N88_13594 [Mikania micrantha]|uniref:Protein kinase domain-containing protein n=1 Tax=Mikania micrantha TaxID=192012 RepID=A0A5N6P922_9ASTR|nr:hypothetical protein E3N88_13594 [Mikania micrantha]
MITTSKLMTPPFVNFYSTPKSVNHHTLRSFQFQFHHHHRSLSSDSSVPVPSYAESTQLVEGRLLEPVHFSSVLERHRLIVLTLIICLLSPELGVCFSLNDEGFYLLRFRDRVVNDPYGALSNWKDDLGVPSPCSWFGVECSNGHVEPDKYASPRTTCFGAWKSFSHKVYNSKEQFILWYDSQENEKMKQLELLDLGYNNFGDALPSDLENSLSPKIILLDTTSILMALLLKLNNLPCYLKPNKECGAAIGGTALVGIAALLLWRCNRVATVRPWATGLSGQLQKAFVTGVPKLKRSELEAACEDFSNVIGSTSFGTVYKGTLSSGVEIAVASVAAPSVKDWSKHLENLFRKRIEMLSKVNHKNFVNLLGYCEEEEPFTRMIAFEYAPNGTLFEHLHIQESEHLDWGMRMRIAMGMAYCLDYMHQLTPPVSLENLNSSSVNLTEDYAAKISDLGLCNDSSTAPTEQTPENNVYSFGVILFEMITGKIPYAGGDAVDDWVIDFLETGKPMIDLVDPTLDSFDADQLEAVENIIRCCVISDPIRRPKMREVTSRLKEITRIAQDGATPKISPLWWAELEILSTEAT